MNIITTHNSTVASTYLSDLLISKLSKGLRVLWLVPGGSGIDIASTVSHSIPDELKQTLTISLTDERYGEIHHPDSNWEQLKKAGFNFNGVTLKPVLNSDSRQKTTEMYSNNLEAMLHSYDYTIGFFGIGPDGHTAGILPGSPAVQATEYAATYDASNFERITMSPKAIVELNEAVAYATGENKWPVIQQLQTTVPIDIQPAQILKAVPKFTLFTDYEGEKI
jgi:6-phosphogluconolactonase/glucosamine-6-phosphate isomerase/deaminase